ncbi:Nucleolar Complex 2 protein [Thoreauomyces humboldtii]|nr:Nucleolar Complex 2 protein [Thoreauomyces humboldtii]
MGKAKKSTKKFVKNKLNDVVTKRKKFQAANKHRKGAKPVPQKGVQEALDEEQELLPTGAESGSESDGGFDDAGLAGPESDSEDDGSDSDLNSASDGEDDLEALSDLGDSDLSDDDDEDEDGMEVDGEQPTPKRRAKRDLNQEIADHKAELEELSRKDPSFFKFLQDNDQELLAFTKEEEAMDTDEEDEQDDQGEGADEDEEDEVEPDTTDSTKLVTKAMIAEWRSSMVATHSLRALRRALLAFRAAAASGDPELEASFTYKVEGGAVFNSLLLLCIKHAPAIFDYHVAGPNAEPGKVRKGLPSNSPKWKKLQPLVKSFLTNLLRILKNMTDSSVVKFVLRESDGSAPYFACFPKIGKDYLKQLLHFWTAADEEIRIVSFLCIRRLAVAAPTPYLDMCIKGSYRAFADQSRNTSIHTWTSINFMINCIVELCGLHMATTYQHGFIYIRQMAMHLRTAITTKSKDSFKKVYNWQFVHSLRLWTRVLATYCDPSNPMEAVGGGNATLRPLIYPIVQVTIGVMRLKPSSRFFPLRFHCVRALTDLAKHTNTFIPVASHLFEILESAELRNKAKPSTQKPLDFTLAIKAPNAYLATRTYQIGLVEEVVSLLFDYYGAFARSISFPELAVPALLQLKRYIKRSKNFQVNKQISTLVDKLVQNSAYIEQARSQVEFSPKDESKANNFLSSVDPNLSPLHKHNTARQAVLAKELARLHADAAAVAAKEAGGSIQPASKKGKKKQQPVSDDEEDEDSEDEEVDGDDDEIVDADGDVVGDFVLSDEDDA